MKKNEKAEDVFVEEVSLTGYRVRCRAEKERNQRWPPHGFLSSCLDGVLVHSGYYHKTLDWQVINNRNLFLSLEAEKSKVKLPGDFMSGEGSLDAS